MRVAGLSKLSKQAPPLIGIGDLGAGVMSSISRRKEMGFFSLRNRLKTVLGCKEGGRIAKDEMALARGARKMTKEYVITTVVGSRKCWKGKRLWRGRVWCKSTNLRRQSAVPVLGWETFPLTCVSHFSFQKPGSRWGRGRLPWCL
jgi:hypothetical protein